MSRRIRAHREHIVSRPRRLPFPDLVSKQCETRKFLLKLFVEREVFEPEVMDGGVTGSRAASTLDDLR